ncbi:MAG: efflux RND transporter permease subunit [Melioribacteraceae bacterium]|nr:efflux RND transporter permease subunit [Melioribacteraceae bacterium]
MLFSIIAVVGFVSLLNLPVELSPHAEMPKLTVSISWYGAAPEAVEAHLTSPVEAELAAVHGIKTISSRTTSGRCSINLEFHPDVDMKFATVDINEKLSALKKELPFGVGIPQVSQYVPDDFKDLQGFMTYTISANRNAGEIRKFINDNIELPLRTIQGVSDITITGGEEREIVILIDYEKTRQLGITNSDIARAVKNAEIILAPGFLKSNQSQYFISLDDNIDNPSVIENQIVKYNNSLTPIRIKDIGRVVDDFKKPTSYYRINGQETVTILLNKEPGANTISTANNVIEKFNELDSVFPTDYIVKKETDKSENVRLELDELYSSAVFSISVILVLLLLIFRKIKYAFIILTSMIFSLLFAFSLFYLFEISLNILTISAFVLGFGFMVDNSIVVIDFLDKTKYESGIRRLTIRLKQIFFPVFASTLTTVAVFLPLLFLTGELRIYFEQFALGIVFTLFASLLVSFTVIPMLYIKMQSYGQRQSIYKPGIMCIIYKSVLSLIIKFKKVFAVIAILMIGLPVWLLPNKIETPVLKDVYNAIFDSEVYSEIKPYINYALGGTMNLFFNHVSRGELWRYYEPTYILVSLNLPHGNEISRINKLTKDFEGEVLAYKKNIKYIIANVSNEEYARLRIEFTREQSRTAFPYRLKNYLSAYAARIGGLQVGVYGFGPGFSTGGGGYSSSFTIVVKGFNFNRVKNLAQEFKQVVLKNPRVDKVDINKSANYWSKDVYEIVGEINREKLDKQNISVNKLFDVIAKQTRGNINNNRFRIDNDEIFYSIKYTNYRNVQLDEVRNAIVKNSVGENAKVKELINFTEQKTLSSIDREDQQYIRYIALDYKGPYKYGNQFVENSIEKVKIPEGYSLAKREFRFLFGAEDEIDIFIILMIAACLIFMITASLFESMKKPLLVIITVPFALIGAVFLFYLTDNNIDRGAYAGMLLLIGLSVNNSIILVDYLSKNLVDYTVENLIKLSYERLRPIFTTTLTTAGALVPLMLSSDAAFWKGLSLSVIGGIVLSAFISILLIPFLYFITNRRLFETFQIRKKNLDIE